jgi:hypothetical protein
MIPALKAFWRDLLNDPAFFARVVRSLLLGYAASAAGLGAMLSGNWRIVVFVTGGISAAVGGLIAAGQMNQPPPPGTP